MTTLLEWISTAISRLYFNIMDNMYVYTDLTLGHLILLIMIISILLYFFRKLVLNGK